MIPFANQILSWEKELEIREQKARKPWNDPAITLPEAPAPRRNSRWIGFAWLARFSPQQSCECAQATRE